MRSSRTLGALASASFGVLLLALSTGATTERTQMARTTVASDDAAGWLPRVATLVAERDPVPFSKHGEAGHGVYQLVQPARATPKSSPLGTWVPTTHALSYSVAEDDGVFSLAVERGPTIRARHLGARTRGAAVLRNDGVLSLPDAGADVDALIFPRRGDIEELLIAKSPDAEPGYVFELPSGYRLSAMPAIGLIEIRDERGVSRLRAWVREAWDADGHGVSVQTLVRGNEVRWMPEGKPRWPVVIDPEWQEAGLMLAKRVKHTASLLADGRVLYAGGGGPPAAEIYDPATESFSAVWKPMTHARSAGTATNLRDGTVLLAGGDGAPLKTAETFDPRTETFSAVPHEMLFTHSLHVATRLSDGRVLLISGTQGGTLATFGQETEIYDPASKSFALGPNLNSDPYGSLAAAKLSDGRVAAFASHDPMILSGGQVTPLGTIEQMDSTATLLPGGLVFLGAGTPYMSNPASLFDPATGQATSLPPLLTIRSDRHAATLLPSGKVLLSGGLTNFSAVTASAELVDPLSSERQSLVMNVTRADHTSTLLPSASILVAGGSDALFGEQFLEQVPPRADVAHIATLTDSDPLGPLPPGNFALQLLADRSVLMTSAVLDLEPVRVLDLNTGVAVGPQLPGYFHSNSTSTLLPDGTVLVVTEVNGASEARLFDPKTASYSTPLGPVGMHPGQSASALVDGRVLVAGGTSAELFDPKTGAFTPTQAAGSSLDGAIAVRLLDGEVLFVGGSPATTGAQVFRPYDASFRAAGPMLQARTQPSATLLPDGRVLVAGGADSDGVPTFTAEIYDPATASFSLTGPMSHARAGQAAVGLPSGQVLVACGTSAGSPAEIYDPSRGAFVDVGSDAIADCSGAAPAPMRTAAATLIPSLLPDGAEPAVLLLHTDRYSTWQPDLPSGTSPRLDSAPPSVKPGQLVELEGSRFEGVSEASSGKTNASATNHPIAVWMPLTGGVAAVGSIRAWNDTAATWEVPSTPFPGLGLLYIVTNGVYSHPRFVSIVSVEQGAPCSSDGACPSGYCVDGVCCDSPCAATCTGCSVVRKGSGVDGVCGPLPAHASDSRCVTDAPSTCGQDGACTEEGSCERYPDGTSCGDKLHCSGGACVTFIACDGDHTLDDGVGSTVDCSPYRCSTTDNRCVKSCTTSLQCVDGWVCSARGACEAIVDEGPAAPGCAVAGAERPCSFALAMAALAALVALRERRETRRRRCRAQRR